MMIVIIVIIFVVAFFLVVVFVVVDVKSFLNQILSQFYHNHHLHHDHQLNNICLIHSLIITVFISNKDKITNEFQINFVFKSLRVSVSSYFGYVV